MRKRILFLIVNVVLVIIVLSSFCGAAELQEKIDEYARLLKLDDTNKAIAYLEKAIESGQTIIEIPTSLEELPAFSSCKYNINLNEARVILARLYIQTGRFDDARPLVDKTLEVYGKTKYKSEKPSTRLVAELAKEAFSHQLYNIAANLMIKALENEPYYNLYMEEIDGRSITYKSFIGLALQKSGQPLEEVIPWYESAVEEIMDRLLTYYDWNYGKYLDDIELLLNAYTESGQTARITDKLKSIYDLQKEKEEAARREREAELQMIAELQKEKEQLRAKMPKYYRMLDEALSKFKSRNLIADNINQQQYVAMSLVADLLEIIVEQNMEIIQLIDKK